MIILDFGSGETCKNDRTYVRKMIDALALHDTGRGRVVIKWQLFTKVPAPVPPLAHETFDFAYTYAKGMGYETTASVFDMVSLDFLSRYDVPFIKVACRRKRYWLLKHIRKYVTPMVSIDTPQILPVLWEKYRYTEPLVHLCCVPEYPANPTVYETMFGGNLYYSISDHSPDTRLYEKYQPWYYERHYKLEDSTGLDAGEFASTPQQLKEGGVI